MAEKKKTTKKESKKVKTTSKKVTPAKKKTEVVANGSKKLSRALKTGVVAEVTAGKFKGEKGQVVSIDRKKNRVYLEKINVMIDYPNKLSIDSGAEPKEKNMGVHISNVKIENS